MVLKRRARHILCLVVETFVEDAQPVSSSAVAHRGKGLKLSPATIRSVMAELEAAGLLHQPHANAGRVPTDLGMRAYLDGLMSPKLHPWDRTRLQAATDVDDPGQFPGTLSRGLAGLTGQLAVVAVPGFLGSHFREMGLVRCDVGRFVAFFVSKSGLVQQKLLQLDFDLTPEEITHIQNFLNDKLAGQSLEQVRSFIQREQGEARQRRDTLTCRALQIGGQALPPPELKLFVEGASNLVKQPEFGDVETLRSLVHAIEDEDALLGLLGRILDASGVTVVLGSEHHFGGVDFLGCVGKPSPGPEGSHAAVSLVGPNRMDYGRFVPLVNYASELFEVFWKTV